MKQRGYIMDLKKILDRINNKYQKQVQNLEIDLNDKSFYLEIRLANKDGILFSDYISLSINLKTNEYIYYDLDGNDINYDNIIDLFIKIGIDINWEDIKNYIPEYINIENSILPKCEFFSFKGYTYNDCGYVFRNDKEEQILYDESFIKVFNILKALKD